jgi:fucose permease
VSSPEGLLAASGSRKALAGFFVSGLLLSFLGAILPAWGYHLSGDYRTIGNYFLAVGLGIVLSVRAGQLLVPRRGIRWTLVFSCALSCAMLLFLAAFGPPFAAWWRCIGLLGVGFAAGLLHTAIFHAISPIYRHDPAATVNLAGIGFGLGCLVMSLLVSGTYYVYTVPSILILTAVIPGLFAGGFAKIRHFPTELAATEPPIRDVLQDFRSPGAILFSLLLFCQFANEWCVGGWLPLFLVQRLGISPATSLLMLALFWGALLIGRVIAQSILPRVSHGRLLLWSVAASLLGCLMLIATDNRFGAIIGILLVGCGFAPVYPLVVEKIGVRFPYYHPGFFNGIFSFAFTGGLLSPFLLGYRAAYSDIRVVMGWPLIGSATVFALLVMIWVEAKMAAPPKARSAGA